MGSVAWLREYNTTFNYTSQFVDTLRAFPRYRTWRNVQNTTWNTLERPMFAETLTFRGVGFTFNMIEEKKLLNIEK
jgi:hypothetical protein